MSESACCVEHELTCSKNLCSSIACSGEDLIGLDSFVSCWLLEFSEALKEKHVQSMLKISMSSTCFDIMGLLYLFCYHPWEKSDSLVDPARFALP